MTSYLIIAAALWLTVGLGTGLARFAQNRNDWAIQTAALTLNQPDYAFRVITDSILFLLWALFLATISGPFVVPVMHYLSQQEDEE